MHKPLAILVTVLLAMGIPVASSDPTDPLAAPERYIIGFYSMPDLEVGDMYYLDRVVALDTDLVFIVVETLNPTLTTFRASLDEAVRYVEYDDPNYAFINFVPNDAQYSNSGHYGSKIVNAETAWDATTGSTSVKLAVVDTGINRNHEDFTGGRVLQGYNAYNNNNDPVDEGGPCSYHGSHTAGTAAATINNGKGIAGMSQSTILPIKIFKKTNNGPFGCGTTTTAIVNGLKHAGDQGAHVSSNSWGGGSFSTAINDAITYAHNKGTIHVAAAGNSGSCTNCIGEPWKSAGDRSIVVSCTGQNDAWCSFSSQGPQVDVAAPGSGILSVDGAANNRYKSLSGTSMSTPHVAGTVALVKTLNPSMSFAQVESRIKGTAHDLGMASDRQGAGRLDAGAAVF